VEAKDILDSIAAGGAFVSGDGQQKQQRLAADYYTSAVIFNPQKPPRRPPRSKHDRGGGSHQQVRVTHVLLPGSLMSMGK